MSRIPPPTRVALCSAAALLLACGSGCTSALTTAALREALWEAGDHAAESAAAVTPPDDVASPGDDDRLDVDAVASGESADQERRAAAIDEAVNRLARLGPLDAATRVTLVETLQRTAQEDWPVVVEAFATTLEAHASSASRPAAAATEDAARGAESHLVAKADLDAVPSAPLPPPAAHPQVPPAPAAAAPTPTDVPPADTPPLPLPPAPPEVAAPAVLMVRNPCFATRVHAWGAVERFARDSFRPGQEVIVYFELENLSASASPAGHTTCIDTSLRLVDAAGAVVERWSFEPIAETCRSRRHDYFARYVVRLPAEPARGACRLELNVVDTLAGTTARETLPLEIVEPAVGGE